MNQTNRPISEGAEKILNKYFPILDYGFISLVDYCGSDNGIEQAARVSYGAGTRKTNETRGLIRYLKRHRHCYDESTEVLTNRGFILWPNVTENDLLAIWDPEKESICYEKPNYLTKEFYSGKMYHVNHLKVNLLVTPEHKMYVDTKKWCPLRKNVFWTNNKKLISSNDLNNKSMIKYFKTAPKTLDDDVNYNDPIFKIGPSIKENLKLIGFFIGDGFAGGTFANGITFHLKKIRKINYLKNICKNGSFKIKKCKNNTYNVYGDNFRDIFRKYFYDSENKKQIPESLMMLSQENAICLIDGLKNSDGSIKRKTFTYASNSKNLIESLQIIGLHAGYSVSINKPHSNLFRLMFLTHHDAVINQHKKNTSWIDYNGYVYCANTRTGILIVRRNNKIVLSGNSTPLEMLELKFHCCMPIFVARQWIRHRTASVNEYSGRYSLMPMMFYTPQKEQFQKQSKSNNQGRSEQLDNDKYEAAVYEWNNLRQQSSSFYEELIQADVARELARIDLPLSTYTQWYWKIDLHNLFHFLTLRVDTHAQWEVREYAKIMAGMVKEVAPLAYEAWIDYDFMGANFSRMELSIVKDILAGNKNSENMFNGSELTKREQTEFLNKIQQSTDVPDFTLDLSLAKSPEYFEEKVLQFVPKIDKD